MHHTLTILAVFLAFLVILLSTCSAGAQAQLVEVHGPEGQRFRINPMFITTLREPIAADRRYFARGARCVVVMVSGKFIATRETCSELTTLLTR